eukprot:4805134-Prymnesium_polylepis.1
MESASLMLEASKLAPADDENRYQALEQNAVFRAFQHLGVLAVSHHLPGQDPELLGGEAVVERVAEGYDYQVHGPVHKSIGSKCDHYRAGVWVVPVVMRYGNLALLDAWHSRALAVWQELSLPATGEYSAEMWELFLTVHHGPLIVLLMTGRRAKAAALLEAIRFKWDGEGFEQAFPAIRKIVANETTFPREAYCTVVKLQIFLASNEGELSHLEVRQWMPAPLELVELDK